MLNLSVHCLMYTYYALASLGKRVPWKQWVTNCQIAQFVADLAVLFFAAYHKFHDRIFPTFPSVSVCEATDASSYSSSHYVDLELIFVGALFVITSYLVLFLQFYARTYGRAKPVSKTA